MSLLWAAIQGQQDVFGLFPGRTGEHKAFLAMDTLAMMHHRTYWDGIVDGSYAQNSLVLAYLFSMVIFLWRLYRAGLSPRPVFGPFFALALSLFIFPALVGFLRFEQVSNYVYIDNLEAKLHEVRVPFQAALVSSGLALSLHLLLYLLSASVRGRTPNLLHP